MLKENWRLISRFERVGDNLIVVAAFFLAYFGRTSFFYWNNLLGLDLPFSGERLAPLRDYLPVLFIALPLYNLFLHVLGAYNSMRFASPWRLFRTSLLSSLLVFFVVTSILFTVKIDLSRFYIGFFCILVTFSLAAERYLVLNVLRYWRKRGKNFRNVIVCGVGLQAREIAREILKRPELGIRLSGFGCVSEERMRMLAADIPRGIEILRDSELSSYHIFCGTEMLEAALKDNAVDEVIFTDVVDCLPSVEEMIVICSELGVRTTLAADLFSVGIAKSDVSYFGSMPLIHYQTPPGDRWELAIKRLVDFAGSMIALIILSPIFAVIALGVRLSSPGAILFKQKRVGLNGRTFSMYKFRSMYTDAERQLERLKESNEMSGPVFKMKDDPRVTSIGRILRRYSLDELPQLWNVLRGDMSLVGPRPPIPGEVHQYVRKHRRRLSMRPGLTCTWQVSGRSDINDFDSWMKLDLDYIDNWSLGRDFSIMCKTVPAVLFGSGAR